MYIAKWFHNINILLNFSWLQMANQYMQLWVKQCLKGYFALRLYATLNMLKGTVNIQTKSTFTQVTLKIVSFFKQ